MDDLSADLGRIREWIVVIRALFEGVFLSTVDALRGFAAGVWVALGWPGALLARHFGRVGFGENRPLTGRGAGMGGRFGSDHQGQLQERKNDGLLAHGIDGLSLGQMSKVKRAGAKWISLRCFPPPPPDYRQPRPALKRFPHLGDGLHAIKALFRIAYPRDVEATTQFYTCHYKILYQGIIPRLTDDPYLFQTLHSAARHSVTELWLVRKDEHRNHSRRERRTIPFRVIRGAQFLCETTTFASAQKTLQVFERAMSRRSRDILYGDPDPLLIQWPLPQHHQLLPPLDLPETANQRSSFRAPASGVLQRAASGIPLPTRSISSELAETALRADHPVCISESPVMSWHETAVVPETDCVNYFYGEDGQQVHPSWGEC